MRDAVATLSPMTPEQCSARSSSCPRAARQVGPVPSPVVLS